MLHPLDFEVYMRELGQLKRQLTSVLDLGTRVNKNTVLLGKSQMFTAADAATIRVLRDTVHEQMKDTLRKQGDTVLAEQDGAMPPYRDLIEEIRREDEDGAV